MEFQIEAQEGVDPTRMRLLALASERGVSLAALSALVGRKGTYLQQFVRKGSPRKLEETDRRTLAEFPGVDEADLGAPAREAVLSVELRRNRHGARRGCWARFARLG